MDSNSTNINITFNGAVVTSTAIDANGNFTATFTVPQITQGTYIVTTSSADTDPAGLNFIVNNVHGTNDEQAI